ncbi:proteasome subunit alpha [Candidatus Methylomirabilis limnetica]|jgi:proteasome alpha subunit|uniref:Proteasome subunit alpha n=1 Tax=Candidatus Methylomirabilis limnetica TaxID=2033718 RepID=A0A2T4U129_9BACT|nr:proteasome subunit alpha [Candidatus Methylomirabilis limnetica]PTL37073.1 proteasome subunit alpha [Candidatus Methylomirabilis limnetica]
MALPYYVSPEQMMQDKAEYARKGIAKGKSIIVLEYADGMLLMAENPSASLNKISEIYDRIAFAGAGRYSEFENLRKAGIRYADMKGFAYDREDVTAKSLANAYSQTIGNVFSEAMKPLEVEILVVEVADGGLPNEVYRIAFDGSIGDEKGFAAIGGQAEELRLHLKDSYEAGLDQKAALRLATQALEAVSSAKVKPQSLEVAVLERSRIGRKFRRLSHNDLMAILTNTD